jgi:hypothetical protein
MKMPWHDQTGLTKLAAIFATTLGIALGLCGANFAAVIKFVPLAGPAPPSGTARWPGQVLIMAGFIELTVIAISAGALIVIGLAAITRAVKNHFTHN